MKRISLVLATLFAGTLYANPVEDTWNFTWASGYTARIHWDYVDHVRDHKNWMSGQFCKGNSCWWRAITCDGSGNCLLLDFRPSGTNVELQLYAAESFYGPYDGLIEGKKKIVKVAYQFIKEPEQIVTASVRIDREFDPRERYEVHVYNIPWENLGEDFFEKMKNHKEVYFYFFPSKKVKGKIFFRTNGFSDAINRAKLLSEEFGDRPIRSHSSEE